MTNRIIKRSKNDLTNQDTSDLFLDLYDAQFDSLSLMNINEKKQAEANDVLSKVTKILEDKGIIDKLPKKTNEKYDYVVQMTDELKEAIDKGEIKFDVGKDGRIFAQLRKNGKYGKKLSITKILKDEGVEPHELTSALQMKSIQQQLEEMAQTLESIEETVNEVKQGQQDDRIGLFYSGMNMYLEGKFLSDPELRKYVTSQALQSISNSNAQLIQQIQSDRNYLLSGSYKNKKGKSYEELQARMDSVNRAFEIIYQSTMLKAAIYYDLNELRSMLMVLNEYKHFIEKVILPVAPQLNEFDKDAKMIDTKWEKRVDTLTNAEIISEQISHSDNYYLGLKEEQTVCQT